MQTRFQSVALLLLALVQPIAGRLAQLINCGKSIEERSDATRGPVTPTKGAFAIWGPLFAGNLVLAVRSFFRSHIETPIEHWIAWLSGAAFAGNSAWSVQAQFAGLGWPSIGIISASAASAGVATILADSARQGSAFARLAANTTGPLAGWLTVATFANVDATLRETRGPLSEPDASRRGCFLVGAASAVATGTAVVTRGNLGYAAAAAWGLGGIFLRNRQESRPAVARTAALGICAVATATLISRYLSRD